jgi:hypothetical protein
MTTFKIGLRRQKIRCPASLILVPLSPSLFSGIYFLLFTFPDKVSRNFGIEYMLEALQTNLASKMSYGFLKNFFSLEGTFYFAVQTRDAVLAKSYGL